MIDPRPPTDQRCGAMILLIDNYDSFTFNLYHFLGDVGARCEVWRNDKLSVAEALAMQPEAIDLLRGIKKVFDPDNILNPGKIWEEKS